MLFRRRGCTMGCGGLLLVCVVLGLLGWFVVIPNIQETLEDGLSQAISTEVANQFEGNYTQQQLQQGQTLRMPLSTLSDQIETNEETDGEIYVEARGQQIVLRWEFQDQSWELRFLPTVTADGRLDLEPEGDSNWFGDRLSDVLASGFELGFNEWLQRNNLVLIDVEVSGNDLLLTVEGQ